MPPELAKLIHLRYYENGKETDPDAYVIFRASGRGGEGIEAYFLGAELYDWFQGWFNPTVFDLEKQCEEILSRIPPLREPMAIPNSQELQLEEEKTLAQKTRPTTGVEEV